MHNHTVRVTGVLLHADKILLVQQQTESRAWSLPGGKLEPGETLEEGLIREMQEETGLDVRLIKQLYVCDKPEDCIVTSHSSWRWIASISCECRRTNSKRHRSQIWPGSPR